MSLDDQLNQIRTLLAQRDNIDHQLEAIIGPHETKSIKPHNPAPRTTGGKTKKRSPNKTRHDDANRNEDIMQALREGEKPRDVAARFKVSIPTVYNIKNRSKSTHAKAQQATRQAQDEPKVRPASKPLDGFQYDALRAAMFDRDFSSAEYALTNKLSPREINAAIKSKDFDDYIDNRDA